jgi:molecular chaperone DnaK (HSP70)
MPAVVDPVKALTGGKEPNTGVNPDEIVAAGACLRENHLHGDLVATLAVTGRADLSDAQWAALEPSAMGSGQGVMTMASGCLPTLTGVPAVPVAVVMGTTSPCTTTS